MLKTSPHLTKFVELMDCMHAVREAMKQYVKQRMKENDIDITFEMFEVLLVLLRNNNDLNQQDLALKLRKNKATITSSIDNLSTRGLVVRKTDPSDRRNNKIELTLQGLKYQEKIQPIINGFFEILHKDLQPEQIQPVNDMLRDMYRDLMNEI